MSERSGRQKGAGRNEGGKNQEIPNPEPHEPVCFNCKYILWLVALGQGVKCKHPAMRERAGGKLFQISSRRFTCEHFETKHSGITERQ